MLMGAFLCFPSFDSEYMNILNTNLKILNSLNEKSKDSHLSSWIYHEVSLEGFSATEVLMSRHQQRALPTNLSGMLWPTGSLITPGQNVWLGVTGLGLSPLSTCYGPMKAPAPSNCIPESTQHCPERPIQNRKTPVWAGNSLLRESEMIQDQWD